MHHRPMKSAILRADEVYDILHNGIWRSFRDTKDAALDAARSNAGVAPKSKKEKRILRYSDGRPVVIGRKKKKPAGDDPGDIQL